MASASACTRQVAMAWRGPMPGTTATSPRRRPGTSSSVELTGFNVIGMEEAAPRAALTAIALEYGTIPTPRVRLALRADNWLHYHGDPASAQGKAIKQQIREAFYQDADDWKTMIWERAMENPRHGTRRPGGGLRLLEGKR